MLSNNSMRRRRFQLLNESPLAPEGLRLLFLCPPQALPLLHRMYTAAHGFVLARSRFPVAQSKLGKRSVHESSCRSLSALQRHGLERCWERVRTEGDALRLPAAGACRDVTGGRAHSETLRALRAFQLHH